jgi:hypothetical protein
MTCLGPGGGPFLTPRHLRDTVSGEYANTPYRRALGPTYDLPTVGTQDLPMTCLP